MSAATHRAWTWNWPGQWVAGGWRETEIRADFALPVAFSGPIPPERRMSWERCAELLGVSTEDLRRGPRLAPAEPPRRRSRGTLEDLFFALQDESPADTSRYIGRQRLDPKALA